MGVDHVIEKLASKGSVLFRYSSAGPKAKGFRFESFKNLLQLFLRGLRNHDRTRTSFAKCNLFRCTEITHAIEMAEEVDNKRFVAGEQRKDRRTAFRRLLSAHRFAAFRFQNFHADGLDVRSKINRLHIKGKRW